MYELLFDLKVSISSDRNLHFLRAVEESIASAVMVFISVNTPTQSKGHGAGQASDLQWVEVTGLQVAMAATGHTVVIEKKYSSGVYGRVRSKCSWRHFRRRSRCVLLDVSNPQFLPK